MKAVVHGSLIYIHDWFLAQRERWVLWTPVFPAFGIIFYFTLKTEPPLYAGLGVLAGLVVGAFPFYRNKPFMLVWLPIFLCALGFTAAQWRTHVVTAPVLQREAYAQTLQGRVAEVDVLPSALRIVLEDIEVKGQPPRQTMPAQARVKLKSNDPAQPAVGDIVSVRAVLLPLSPPVLPGSFDFQRHAFFLRLGATGYAVGNVTIVTPHETGFFFENLRRTIGEKIRAAIADKDRAAIVSGLLVNESKGISNKTWDVIRLAGIAHLLAISGMHITLVAGFVFFLVRGILAAVPYVVLRWPIKKIAAVTALVGAVFYTLLIGSPIPAVRATIMLGVVMTAVLLDRDALTLRLAAFSALVILVLLPEALMGPSFQMSFAAVVALIAFYESLRHWWGQHAAERTWLYKAGIYLLGCFLTTLIASLATAPFALFHFSRIPLFSGLVANMIAVPVSSIFIMPFGILACFLMPFGLEHWSLYIADESVAVIMRTAETVVTWPHAVMKGDSWPGWLLGMITLGGLWLCIWQGWVRFLGLAPILAAALLIPLSPRADILASADGKIFAVRDAGGKLWMSSARAGRFVREEWVQQEGGAGIGYWQDAPPEVISCDTQACLYRKGKYTVSFIMRPEAVLEDCSIADVIISGKVIPDSLCPGKPIIDKWALRDEGAHTLFLDVEQGITIRTVAGERGQRPWMPQPQVLTGFGNNPRIHNRSWK